MKTTFCIVLGSAITIAVTTAGVSTHYLSNAINNTSAKRSVFLKNGMLVKVKGTSLKRIAFSPMPPCIQENPENIYGCGGYVSPPPKKIPLEKIPLEKIPFEPKSVIVHDLETEIPKQKKTPKSKEHKKISKITKSIFNGTVNYFGSNGHGYTKFAKRFSKENNITKIEYKTKNNIKTYNYKLKNGDKIIITFIKDGLKTMKETIVKSLFNIDVLKTSSYWDGLLKSINDNKTNPINEYFILSKLKDNTTLGSVENFV